MTARTRYVTIRMTVAEAEAALNELRGSTESHETENPGPYHRDHHAAKRGAKKISDALVFSAIGGTR